MHTPQIGDVKPTPVFFFKASSYALSEFTLREILGLSQLSYALSKCLIRCHVSN
jgi:hypothetical protein